MRDFSFYSGPMVTWPVVETLPYVKEVLAELYPQCMLVLATNAVDSDEKAIKVALYKGELNGFLDRVYCYGNVGYKKPSREFFEFIMEDLKLEPSAFLMVGDNFPTDVLGANGAGIRAIWFNEHNDKKREGAMYQTIHDFRDLPRISQHWLGTTLRIQHTY